MTKTIVLVHGRAPKPLESDLKHNWTEALKHGIRSFCPEAAHSQLEALNIEFVYYGDINNAFLKPDGYDTAKDARRREVELDRLKRYDCEAFYDENTYLALPGQNPWKERLADSISGIFNWLRLSDNLIEAVAPDMAHYWNPESEFGSEIRSRMIDPLKNALNSGKTAIIAHSLGTMVAWDTLWKFSRYSEYREYREKQVDLFLTIGCPLADSTVMEELKGSRSSGARRYPTNIRRWVNVAARDDFVSHDQEVANDYAPMLRYELIKEIRDYRIFNLATPGGRSNPHHAAGYLLHPTVASVVGSWLADSPVDPPPNRGQDRQPQEA